MLQQTDIEALQDEIVEMVVTYLTPVAMRYGYSEAPLETNIKWRPLILVIGNYSSGKSTLINEFLGAEIQATGQAPTDDSFTILTHDDTVPESEGIRVVEERDGNFLLSESEYPFENLKKYGQRFASHFRLKKINAPFLRHLALIDTPGMHDSITERDRGYNYQEVVGELAEMADLVLVLFDPHKAGTVRETHTSLRETLPSRTFEDRVLFVLNRIDECASLVDLIRVYGTLCWNLSQITGRKDIPAIHLTYAETAMPDEKLPVEGPLRFLPLLKNQREELKAALLKTPRRRLDNLITFVETHGERLTHFLEALLQYRENYRMFNIRHLLIGIVLALIAGGGGLFGLVKTGVANLADEQMMLYWGGGIAAGVFLLWTTLVHFFAAKKFHAKMLAQIDELTPLSNQARRDSWRVVRDLAYLYLKNRRGRYSLTAVQQEHYEVRMVCEKGIREIREALNELSATGDDDEGYPHRHPAVRYYA